MFETLITVNSTEPEDRDTTGNPRMEARRQSAQTVTQNTTARDRLCGCSYLNVHILSCLDVPTVGTRQSGAGKPGVEPTNTSTFIVDHSLRSPMGEQTQCCWWPADTSRLLATLQGTFESACAWRWGGPHAQVEPQLGGLQAESQLGGPHAQVGPQLGGPQVEPQLLGEPQSVFVYPAMSEMRPTKVCLGCLDAVEGDLRGAGPHCGRVRIALGVVANILAAYPSYTIAKIGGCRYTASP